MSEPNDKIQLDDISFDAVIDDVKPEEELTDLAVEDPIEDEVEDAFPGDMAQAVIQGHAQDPKAVEKEFSAYVPG